MLVIGLTGGIGSGKSTVGQIFSDLGVPVIDADQVSRRVMQPGGAAHLPLKFWLGSDYFSANGELDRKKLRNVVFDNHQKLHRLESIVHPLVRQEFVKKLSELEPNNSYAVMEIPLLTKAHKQTLVQQVLVVDCSPETQIQRSSQRDGVSASDIEKIIAIQMSRAERLALADDVINNDGELQQLERTVEQLHLNYLEHATNQD